MLRLAGLPPAIIRVPALTAALALFYLHDTLEDALAVANPQPCRRSPPR